MIDQARLGCQAMDNVKRASGEFNRMGKKTHAAGIQLGLHNKGFEVSRVNGKPTYDVLLQTLDPQLIKFQFQCSTISYGFVAADYFTKYPGRFISLHAQDGNPAPKQEVAVGTGSIDWKKTFAAAKVGGIKNYLWRWTLA